MDNVLSRIIESTAEIESLRILVEHIERLLISSVGTHTEKDVQVQRLLEALNYYAAAFRNLVVASSTITKGVKRLRIHVRSHFAVRRTPYRGKEVF